MSFVDGMLMEYMKFLCKWRTIVFYGPGNWKFLALGWLVKIHMEWDGGFASFLVMHTYLYPAYLVFLIILLLLMLIVYSLPSLANFKVI
jgi:hypothetical protein